MNNFQNITILTDYGGTLDNRRYSHDGYDNSEPDSHLLIEVLEKFKEAGTHIIMVSDGSRQYRNSPPDVEHIIDEAIHPKDINYRWKYDPAYWPMLLQKLSLNAEDVIFLDDDMMNIDNAQEHGITTIHVCNFEKASSRLLEKYNQLSL